MERGAGESKGSVGVDRAGTPGSGPEAGAGDLEGAGCQGEVEGGAELGKGMPVGESGGDREAKD